MNAKLINRRERMALTRGEISRMVGISPSYYSALEYDQRKLSKMSLDKALRLVDTLGCDFRDILTDEEMRDVYGYR